MRNKLTLAIILVVFMSLFSIKGEAQNYKMAAGLRAGYPTSATIKYFISESSALEGYIGTSGSVGLLGSSYRRINLSGAYLIHRDLDWLDGLQFYYGAGASVFFGNYGDNSTSFGIQAYGGFDYTFDNIPLNLTVDWIPTFIINNNDYNYGFGSGFRPGYGTVAARYIISE